MAMAALEDCVSAVSAKPRAKNITTLSSGLASVPRASSPVMPAKPACSVSMPTKNTPKPATASPRCARRPRSSSRASMPSPISGRAKAAIFSSKPTRATIQAVMVVPRLLPKTTRTAWRSESSPALTKPSVATVTAVEDCTSAVTTTPERMPRRVVRVPRRRICCSAPPAACCRPPVISCMPSRNRPMPPSTPSSAVMTGSAAPARA